MAFTVLDVDLALRTKLEYQPPFPGLYKKFYCRIRAKDSLGRWGVWSETRVFSHISKEKSAPVLLQPGPNEKVKTQKLLFKWTPPTEKLFCRFELNSSSAFSYALIIHQSEVESDSLLIDDLHLAPGDYYWRVSCKGDGNFWGEWHEGRTFNVYDVNPDSIPPAEPILVSPDNKREEPDANLSFKWKTVKGAHYYRIQIDNDVAFGSVAYDTTLAAETGFLPPSGFEDGTYYWRVAALSKAKISGEWSNIYKFRIDTRGPDKITPNKPYDAHFITDRNPLMIWNVVTGAYRYQLQLDNSGKFGDVITDEAGITSNNLVIPIALSDGKYYWRVRARDRVGNWGQWSEILTFSVRTAEHYVPVLKFPVADTVLDAGPIQFRWSGGAESSMFKVQLSTGNYFSGSNLIIQGVETSDKNYLYNEMLEPGGYYWRVLVLDGYGNWIGGTTLGHFIITE